MEPVVTVLSCPKCHVSMRTYERDGIQVDQCVECRGIFLDPGELDRLLDAGAASGPAPAPDRVAHREHRRSGLHDGGYLDDRGYGRKRRGMLSDLFD